MFTDCFILDVFPNLFTSRGKLVWVRSQGFEVIRDGLEMSDLSQHGNFLILKEYITKRAEVFKKLSLHSNRKVSFLGSSGGIKGFSDCLEKKIIDALIV